MIEGVRLRNFKCFAKLPLSLSGLTLLAGMNGTGKSSVLQSLLLLRQSWQQGLLESGKLALNGELVQVGTAKDALYSGAVLTAKCTSCGTEIEAKAKGKADIGACPSCGSSSWDEPRERIGFSIIFGAGAGIDLDFVYDRDADVIVAPRHAAVGPELARESLFSPSFQYLCAERLGPRNSFPVSDYTVAQQRQVGIRGEYTVQFLTSFGGKEDIQVEALAHPEAINMKLASQVEAWMNVISPGTRLKLTPHMAMDLVQLQYQFVAGHDLTDAYRPTNVGFGLTYTLPILVAVLAASPGALILVENPEAHLHPRGQARMGEFLARAASGGVQIMIETHSDHVLNGLRIAVHDGLLDANRVKLHFFRRDEEHGTHEVISPRLDRQGRFDRRPRGFFDEWDESLRVLLTSAKSR